MTILDCGHEPSKHESFTTGYGQNAEGQKFCYECIAKMDKEAMQKSGRFIGYLVNRDGKYFVTNWPASLEFPIRGNYVRKSRHNIGRERLDFWFIVDGKEWHGYQIGDNNEIAHCKRNK